MSEDPTRRFTDREVAVVLRKAVEIDETEGSGAGGGLSLQDLREIAKEVGISASAVDRAVLRLDTRGATAASWAGAPLVRKAVRAVPRELDSEAISRLVRIVDERTDTAGSVSEALGSVRWTAADRFRSSLVTVTPRSGETAIEVVEKANARMRRVMHLVPAAWGVMLAAPGFEAVGSALGLPGGLGLAAIGVAAGAGVGRLVWNTLSRQSSRRVERLAAALAEEAHAHGPDAPPDLENPMTTG